MPDAPWGLRGISFRRRPYRRRAGALSAVAVGVAAAVLIGTGRLSGGWLAAVALLVVVALLVTAGLLLSLVDDQAIRESRAEEAMTMLLATTSHEFKTPLTVIRGYAQLLRIPGVEPEERQHAIEAIEARTAQLVEIVDRLLMSSRIESGRIELVPRMIPIADLLRDRARAFSDAHRPLVIEIAPGLPPALAEESALATAVDHLLDNADKYSPAGADIVLEADHDDDRIAIRVRDHGIGMSEEEVARCFDRFWQAEGTDARRYGGTGIGLYIVRSLVEAMQGSVTAAPNPDAGMTFTIRLRRWPVASEGPRPGDAGHASSAG